MERTLLVGDVHGCAGELHKLIARTRPTRVVLVGDLFTRGPDPEGVWALIERHRIEAVLGNHDEEVLKTWRPERDLPRKAFGWLEALPLVLKDDRWVAVHAGVHPEKALKYTTREQALHLREWRDARGRRRPWWQEYRKKRLVVHGHDARNGLIDRRPHTLGLDTGCVKGGWLTGYVVEVDALVQVKAERRYAR